MNEKSLTQTPLSANLDPSKSWVEIIVELLGGSLRKVVYPDGETWYVVGDYVYYVMQSKAKDKGKPWRDFKARHPKLKAVADCDALWIDTDGGAKRMDCMTETSLYRLTMSMSDEYPAVSAVKDRMAGLVTFTDWARRHPDIAGEMLLTIDAKQQQEKMNRTSTQYVITGNSQSWAQARVEAKISHVKVTGALRSTHQQNDPDYGRIFGAQNEALLGKAKAEIIKELDLTPAQAKSFRDHLGEYAQKALREANELATRKMKTLGRALTDEEQTKIIIASSKLAAEMYRHAAEYIGEDFVSGAPLDEDGKALIVRRTKLIDGSSGR